ncbi:hypothetical protein [Spirosoma aerophilum]
MKDTLITHIWDENNRLQALPLADEPASMEASYERLQQLVWDLKQTDYKATGLNRVWVRIVRIGNYELRNMRHQYQKMLRSPGDLAERTDYVHSHGQLKEKINQIILLIFDPIPSQKH